MWDTQVRSLVREDPMEKASATYSSILAWETPWTEGPSRLLSSRGDTHDWATEQQQHVFPSLASARTCRRLESATLPNEESISLCSGHPISWYFLRLQLKERFLKATFWVRVASYGLSSNWVVVLPGEISITSDMQMTPPLGQKVKRN